MADPVDTPRQERHFSVLLRLPHRVNVAWLENQAIELEESLIERCKGEILGLSVSANFAENGFELDLTVEAASPSEAYGKLGRLYEAIEEVAPIKIGGQTDEVQSSWESNAPTSHQPAVLA